MSMLKYFFQAPYQLRQLRRKPLSQQIEALAEKLHRLGFKRASGQCILRLAGKFNDFARSVGVETAEGIDERLVKHFFKKVLLSSGTFRDAPSAMRHLLEHLRDQSVIPRRVAAESADPFEPILSRYDGHLRDVRGLTPSSRSHYLRYARQLLSWLEKRRGDSALTELTGVDVLEFVKELAPLHPSGSWRQSLCSLTRVFLRYLRWEGVIQIDLDRLVPTLPRWRLSALPRHLPWKLVRELIDGVDTAKRGGLRDKAVLLVIATLGLRRQEVSRLQLDHIEWRTAEIRVTETKSRRERALPLSQEVGATLADYILHERPSDAIPEVFLSNRAPHGPITPHAIGDIVGRHLRRAGIRAPNYGAHLLRHSLATRLVNQGVPIKHIADLLGHASIDTTAIYTKVDRATLANVALPFPGGEA
jgi:site-specific recombinase XerD